MPLQAHEVAALQQLYLNHRVPTDQFLRRPVELQAFVDEWNASVGREDSADDVLHYMKSKRKQGKWPRLNGDCKENPSLASLFTPEQVETLVDIYQSEVIPLGIGSNSLPSHPDVLAYLVREFVDRTRLRLPDVLLVAKLEELRKDGMLPKVGKRAESNGMGFSDIDEVAG